jgi:hypothetical protein
MRYQTQPKSVRPEMMNLLDLLIDITPCIDCYYLIAVNTLTENYTDFSLSYPIEVSISHEFFDRIYSQLIICDIG